MKAMTRKELTTVCSSRIDDFSQRKKMLGTAICAFCNFARKGRLTLRKQIRVKLSTQEVVGYLCFTPEKKQLRHIHTIHYATYTNDQEATTPSHRTNPVEPHRFSTDEWGNHHVNY